MNNFLQSIASKLKRLSSIGLSPPASYPPLPEAYRLLSETTIYQRSYEHVEALEIHYDYDTNGLLTSRRLLRYGPVPYSSETRYTYSQNNYLLSLIESEQLQTDKREIQIVESQFTYDYPNRRLIRETENHRPTGDVPYQDVTEYIYNADGMLSQIMYSLREQPHFQVDRVYSLSRQGIVSERSLVTDLRDFTQKSFSRRCRYDTSDRLIRISGDTYRIQFRHQTVGRSVEVAKGEFKGHPVVPYFPSDIENRWINSYGLFRESAFSDVYGNRSRTYYDHQLNEHALPAETTERTLWRDGNTELIRRAYTYSD
ncbi:hypothetical protein BN8_01268 [Fibrisoma limi BUZ 3]|uniref:Uncharacterized protein n=1 Tax=Fibrisoma limi BUZ 3 TaxID=1185876 RepID=I2GEF7_9BACT|nr:hypothetical protein [Fibrisoma limi]CCH52282.1 hypothetical protein BN8_01268 [Fibrisoma limi BUZ 3]